MSISDITLAALSNGVEPSRWAGLSKRFLARASSETDASLVSEQITAVLLPFLLETESVHPLIYQYLSSGLQNNLVKPAEILSVLLEFSTSVPTTPQKLKVLNVLAPELSLVDTQSSQIFLSLVSDLLSTSVGLLSCTDGEDYAPLVAAVERCGGSRSLLNKISGLSPQVGSTGLAETQEGIDEHAGDSGLRPTSPDCLLDPRTDQETPESQSILVPPAIYLTLYHLAHDPDRHYTPKTISNPGKRKRLDRSILDLAPILASSPSNFLYYLVAGSLEQVLSALEATSGDQVAVGGLPGSLLVGKERKGLEEMIWLKEGLGELLNVWRNDMVETGHYHYPNNLAEILQQLLLRLSPRLSAVDQTLQHQYERLWGKGPGFHEGLGGNDMDLALDFSAFENSTASSGVLPLADVLVEGLFQAGLLNESDALTVYPARAMASFEEPADINYTTFLANPAEEQMFRLLLGRQALADFSNEMLSIIRAGSSPFEHTFVHLSEALSSVSIFGISRTKEAFEEGLKAFDRQGSTRIEDAQGGMVTYGNLVMCIQTLYAEYSIPVPECIKGGVSSYGEGDLSAEERSGLAKWIKALFGTGGIDDDTMQATPPPVFLRLAPILVAQACVAAQDNVISFDTLKDGLSYFDQPILTWCLGNVLEWLTGEILRQGAHAAYHVEIISILLSGKNLPPTVILPQKRHLRALIGVANLDNVLKKVGISIYDDVSGSDWNSAAVAEHSVTSALQVIRSEERVSSETREAVILLSNICKSRGILALLALDLEENMPPSDDWLWSQLLLLPDGVSDLPMKEFVEGFVVPFIQTDQSNAPIASRLARITTQGILALSILTSPSETPTVLARRLYVEMLKAWSKAGRAQTHKGSWSVITVGKGVKDFAEMLLCQAKFIDTFPFMSLLKSRLI